MKDHTSISLENESTKSPDESVSVTSSQKNDTTDHSRVDQCTAADDTKRDARSSPVSCIDESTLKMSDKAELLASSEKSTVPGIDNPAFEGDHHLQNGVGSPGAEHVTGNGFHLNHNGKEYHNQKDDSDYKTTEEMAEAVNLELLNMSSNVTNGLNGIPVKSPNSTVINMSNPYDEYFIPVNEHRKYIRGEKLYVTKTKRDLENSKKSCCVWLVGLVTVLVAICLAILIAKELNHNDSTPVPNDHRGFPEEVLGAGINYQGDSPPSTTVPPYKMPDIARPQPSPGPEETVKAHLKRAVEGEFTISEMKWSPAYSDHDSDEFKALAGAVEEELKRSLFDYPTLHHGAADIHVRVINLTPEKVVQYRISWMFKPGIQNPPDPINTNTLKERLTEYIRRNNGSFNDYQVPLDKIYSKYMINDCSINNGNCSHSCKFDYEKMLDFYCDCPPNMTLDETQYNCQLNNNLPKAEPEPPSAEPEPAKAEPEPPSAEPEPAKAEPEPPSAEPESAKAEPEPPSAEPEVSKAEPSSVEPEPSKAEPSSVEPEPSKAEPSSVEPEPSKAEPSSVEPEPSKSEPSSVEPESAKAEPTSAEPESAKSEPASVEPESAKAEPEPPSAEPESARAEPEPPSAEPEFPTTLGPKTNAEPVPFSKLETPSTQEPTPMPEVSSQPPQSSSISSSTLEPKTEGAVSDQILDSSLPDSTIEPENPLPEPEPTVDDKRQDKSIKDTVEPVQTTEKLNEPGNIIGSTELNLINADDSSVAKSAFSPQTTNESTATTLKPETNDLAYSTIIPSEKPEPPAQNILVGASPSSTTEYAYTFPRDRQYDSSYSDSTVASSDEEINPGTIPVDTYLKTLNKASSEESAKPDAENLSTLVRVNEDTTMASVSAPEDDLKAMENANSPANTESTFTNGIPLSHSENSINPQLPEISHLEASFKGTLSSTAAFGLLENDHVDSSSTFDPIKESEQKSGLVSEMQNQLTDNNLHPDRNFSAPNADTNSKSNTSKRESRTGLESDNTLTNDQSRQKLKENFVNIKPAALTSPKKHHENRMFRDLVGVIDRQVRPQL